MSRCSQSEGLLEAVFTDRDLSRAQAAHVGSCVVCARALAEIRLFERELWRTGSELAEEALPSANGLLDSAGRPNLKGGSMTSWRDVAASVGIAVALVLVVFGGGAWLGSQLSSQITAGPVAPAVVDAWVEAARAPAVQEAARFGPPDPAVWEAVQVELCGDTAIAFYSDGNRGAGYVWAIGRPREPASAVLDTGSAARIEDSGVAALRAMLPICEVVRTDPEAPAVVLKAMPAEAQTVTLVPALHWVGAAEDAPVLVEPEDDRMVGLRTFAFFQGAVDDLSIQAVDIITDSGRLRFPASVPGFSAETNLDGAGLRFEFRDGQGNVVAAGPVVELNDADVRRGLEAGMRADLLAEAERRALEDGRVGARCAEWQAFTDLEQMTITAVVIADLEQVRIVQQLAPGTSVPEILASARESIGKACQGSPADRAVANIARALYGDD